MPDPGRSSTAGADGAAPVDVDVALERSLEALFRLGANRRFDARQAELVGAAVTRAGYAVLRGLADHGSVSLREAAAASAMDTATASRQVQALVDEGLVERRTAPGDARVAELSLTPRGHDVYERIVRYRLEHLRRVVSGWSEPDRATLAHLVARLVDGLATTPVAAPNPDP